MVVFSAFVDSKANNEAKQSNQQKKITLIDEKRINEANKLIEGTKLTPDCEFAWTVQKHNNSKGQQVIDVDNGNLSFQIIPERGMLIQNVTYLSSTGKITLEGKEFNAENTPTMNTVGVEVVIDQTAPYKITIRGKINESLPYDSILHTIIDISTIPGASTFQFSNAIDFVNFNKKTTATEKPSIKLADVIKTARSWEPSFKEWYEKPAPDLTITDITGKKHKISDYRGKNLIVNVWATWCPPCKREIPDFIELRKEIKEDELAILGISTENGEDSKVKKFVQDNKMNYTIAVADFMKLTAPYSNIEAIPTTFFIDKQGKIKLATIGMLTLKDVKNILAAQ